MLCAMLYMVNADTHDVGKWPLVRRSEIYVRKQIASRLGLETSCRPRVSELLPEAEECFSGVQ